MSKEKRETQVMLQSTIKNEGITTKEIRAYSLNRILRTVVGVAVIFVAVLAFSVSHIIIPILTKTAMSFTMIDVAIYGLFFGIGSLMIDRHTGFALFTTLLDKLPIKRS